MELTSWLNHDSCIIQCPGDDANNLRINQHLVSGFGFRGAGCESHPPTNSTLETRDSEGQLEV
jgi:hypothetical protein